MTDDDPKINIRVRRRRPGQGKLSRMKPRTLKAAEKQVEDAAAPDPTDITEVTPQIIDEIKTTEVIDDSETFVPLPEQVPALTSPSYKPEYARQARAMCKLGASDVDLADWFGVSVPTMARWRVLFPEFGKAHRVGKEEFDDRVERTLAMRAIGYTYEAEKIFCNAEGQVTRVAYREHVPPDITACIFWLKNRRPEKWREKNDRGNGVINITITEEESRL